MTAEEERTELARQADRLAAGNAEAAALGQQLHDTFEELISKTGIPRAVNLQGRVVVVSIVVALVAVVGAALGLLNQHATNNANHERRITGAGQRYSQCIDGNEHAAAVDFAIQNAFAPGFARPGANLGEFSRYLDTLRSKLSRKDCESILVGLSTADKARARAVAAAIPRQPLPPPTIPGYVPSGGTP